MSWPFESWLQIAVRRFGLAPSEFWAMPVAEWLALIEGTKTDGIDRETLDDLLQQFPDTGGSYEPDR